MRGPRARLVSARRCRRRCAPAYPVVPEADEDERVLLAEDGLVDLPAVCQVRQKVRLCPHGAPREQNAHGRVPKGVSPCAPAAYHLRGRVAVRLLLSSGSMQSQGGSMHLSSISKRLYAALKWLRAAPSSLRSYKAALGRGEQAGCARAALPCTPCPRPL